MSLLAPDFSWPADFGAGFLRDCSRIAKRRKDLRRVYFIQGAPAAPVKIGMTAHPERRLQALRRGTHEDLAIRVTIPGGRVVEQILHGLFQESRVRGEWFRATAALEHLIKQLTAASAPTVSP